MSNNVFSLHSYDKVGSIKLSELFPNYSVVAVDPNTHIMIDEIECDGMTEWYCGTYFYNESLVSNVIDKLNIDDFYVLYDTQHNKLVGFVWNYNMQASYESLKEWEELKSKVMKLIHMTDHDIIKMIMGLNDIDKLKEYIKKYAMLGFTDISEHISDDDYQYLINH